MDLIELEEIRKEAGITEAHTFEESFCHAWKTNKSMLKGCQVELYFKKRVESLSFETVIEKMADHDDKYRFDHLVLAENNETKRFEVRTLLKSGIVKLDFRDRACRNNPPLPSGRLWETTARSKSKEESFDFLAISLVNFTGDYNEFAYLHRSKFPSYCNFNKEQEAFSDEDRRCIIQNYYAKSIKVPLPIEAPFTSNLEEVLTCTCPDPIARDEEITLLIDSLKVRK